MQSWKRGWTSHVAVTIQSDTGWTQPSKLLNNALSQFAVQERDEPAPLVASNVFYQCVELVVRTSVLPDDSGVACSA